MTRARAIPLASDLPRRSLRTRKPQKFPGFSSVGTRARWTRTRSSKAAAKLVAKGAYDKAIKEYQKVLDADPKDVRVLQKMGELYQKKNDNAQAAHYFTKVAESYSTDGFFLKAVALYKQVLKLNPNLLEVNLKLAELHQQLRADARGDGVLPDRRQPLRQGGRHQGSLDTLKKMVDLDPENVASRIKLAELYARENMNDGGGHRVQARRRVPQAQQPHRRLPARRRAALPRSSRENLHARAELADVVPAARRPEARAGQAPGLLQGGPARRGDAARCWPRRSRGWARPPRRSPSTRSSRRSTRTRGRTDEADGIWRRSRSWIRRTRTCSRAARRPPRARRAAARPSRAGARLARAPRPACAAAPAPAPRRAARPGARASARAAARSAAPRPQEQLAKLLTETDVYVKYGLHDKALEHLRKIFAVDPENLDAHEKAYHIYVAASNDAQASEQLLNVLRLCTRRADVQRAQPYLATILQQNPAHPEVPAFLAVLRSDGRGAGGAAGWRRWRGRHPRGLQRGGDRRRGARRRTRSRGPTATSWRWRRRPAGLG